MQTTANSLQSVLVLLASSVLAVAVCRKLKLPAMIGYVATGLAVGPHALGLVSDRDEMRHLAEEMIPIFRSRDVHREALAALLTFQKAAEMECVTLGLIREVSYHLKENGAAAVGLRSRESR